MVSPSSFEHVKISRLISEGAYKSAYEIERWHDVLLLRADTPNKFSLEEMELERKLLKKLHEIGIPAAQFIELGEHEGYPAALMEKYVASTKGRAGSKTGARAFVEVANKESIAGLNSIMRVLNEKQVWIDDIQFLYRADGSVVVHDPLEVKGLDELAHDDSCKWSYALGQADEIAVEISMCAAAIELRRMKALPDSDGALHLLLDTTAEKLRPRIDVKISFS